MKRPKAVSVERRVAAGVGVAVAVAAVLAVTIFVRLTDTRADEAARIESLADSLAQSLAGGAPPQAVLSAIVDTGAVGGAVLYDANGAPAARAGRERGVAGEVICRTLPNGTLCVEPANAVAIVRTKRITDAMIAAGAATVIVAVAAALLMTWMTRRSMRGVRNAVEHAVADATFAQRIAPAGGELAPLVASVNNLLGQMQSRESELRRRTHDLEVANKDLESFAHTVSHDLRGPLGSVLGFAEALRDGYGGELNADGQEYTHWIVDSGHQMRNLIDGLLNMSRLSRTEMQRDVVDLSAVARSITASLQKSAPERAVDFTIAENVLANGDERLLRAVLENLIANAWKFTSKRERAAIEFGMSRNMNGGPPTYFVRDNGAGFDPTHAAKMFRPFQRLHSSSEFEGTGIGLATVQRILQRHGGKAWAEGEPDQGATIYFTTGAPHESGQAT